MLTLDQFTSIIKQFGIFISFLGILLGPGIQSYIRSSSYPWGVQSYKRNNYKKKFKTLYCVEASTRTEIKGTDTDPSPPTKKKRNGRQRGLLWRDAFWKRNTSFTGFHFQVEGYISGGGKSKIFGVVQAPQLFISVLFLVVC